MDFTGYLNYWGETEKAPPQLGVPATIHDARVDRGVEGSPRDSTDLLLDGEGFLLVHAPSAVDDWTDVGEQKACIFKHRIKVNCFGFKF